MMIYSYVSGLSAMLDVKEEVDRCQLNLKVNLKDPWKAKEKTCR